jgi:poly(3-hydroxybutyrate) depolymerase
MSIVCVAATLLGALRPLSVMSHRLAGQLLLSALALSFVYCTVWTLVLPFVEADQPLHLLFPPRHYAVALPALFGSLFLLAVATHIALLLIRSSPAPTEPPASAQRSRPPRAASRAVMLMLCLCGVGAQKRGQLVPVPVSGEELRHEFFLPAPRPPEGTRTPLLVFLHGRGESGSFDVTNAQSLPLQLRTNFSFSAAFPFAVLVPQCPETCASENGWPDEVLAQLTQLIATTVSKHNLDPRRISLAGQSMGGNGAWLYAAQQRKLFAALVVICGYAAPKDASRIADRLSTPPMPITVFHSADDVVIPVSASETMVRLLGQSGNHDVRFVRYDTAPGPPMKEYEHLLGHGAYELAFRDASLYAWLLNQTCAYCGPEETTWRPLHGVAHHLRSLLPT